MKFMETLCELTTRPFRESDQKDTDGLRIGDNVGRFSFLLKTDADDVFVSIEAVLSSLCKLISPKEILCEGNFKRNMIDTQNQCLNELTFDGN